MAGEYVRMMGRGILIHGLLFNDKDADGGHGDKGKEVPANGGIFVALHKAAVDILVAHEALDVGS